LTEQCTEKCIIIKFHDIPISLPDIIDPLRVIIMLALTPLAGLLSLLSLTVAQPTETTPYTNLPPPTSPGVFSASTRILIQNTTTALAWTALTNFPAYAEWNPFVRSAVVVDEHNDTAPEQYPVEGLNLLLRTQIPPLKLPVDRDTRDNPLATQYAYEEITHVQPELGRLAWKYASDALVKAERWQAVSDAGDGAVLYESREVFDGLLSRRTCKKDLTSRERG
jgi:hypothetical protein